MPASYTHKDLADGRAALLRGWSSGSEPGLVITKAASALVWDSKGNEYIDTNTPLAVTASCSSPRGGAESALTCAWPRGWLGWDADGRWCNDGTQSVVSYAGPIAAACAVLPRRSPAKSKLRCGVRSVLHLDPAQRKRPAR